MSCYSTRLASFRGKRKWKGEISPANMARAGFIFEPNPDAPDNCRCFTCNVEVSGWDVGDDPLDEHLRHSSGCVWARVMGTFDHTTADRLSTFRNWPHPTKNFRPSPLALAQAGFFFNPGHSGDDATSCAFCGTCLNMWAAEDVPLEEHRAVNGECEYVLRCFETSSLVDSHLVEGSLGVIPVLQPATSSANVSLPDQTLEQSVYGTMLEDSSEHNASVADDMHTSDDDGGNTSELVSNANPAKSAGICVSPNSTGAYETAPGGDTRCDESMDDFTEKSCLQNATSNEEPVIIDIETSESTVHDVDGQQSITKSLPEEDLANERSQSSEPEGDSSAQIVSMSGPNTSHLHGDSMVTVSVEEVSVDSTTVSEAGLNDPETPSHNTPQSAPESERPAFSVFKSAFTSTPFNRMSPTKMMSTAPMPSPLGAPLPNHHEENIIMPSPLAALPIDLARTSFGNQQQDQSIQARMYPRLPSFPSMQGSMTSYGHDQFKEPSDQLGCLDSGQQDFDMDRTSTFHTADNERSTPSPIRSPHRSSIIGSSPVRNSFDELIQSLPPLTHEFPGENQVSDKAEAIQLDSQLSNLDISAIEGSAPNRKELLTEFKNYLPASSIEFLLQAKSQTVEEWQVLLADEVERQILRITEEAVEQAEIQRKRVIQEIRAQYGC